MATLLSAFLALLLFSVGFCSLPLQETCSDPLFQCYFEDDSICRMNTNAQKLWSLSTGEGYSSTASVSFGTDARQPVYFSSKLYTPYIAYSGEVCVRFAYRSNGRAESELYFGVSDDRGEQAIKFFKGASLWMEFGRTIYLSGSSRDYRFFWKAIGYGSEASNEDLRAIVYVDNVCISAGVCSGKGKDAPTADEVGLNAEFLNANQLDLFYQEQNDDGDWNFTRGPTPSENTGPPSGEMNDGYIYFETSDPVPNGGSAKLKARYLGIQGPACLKFYYYMYGWHLAQGWLSVFRKERNLAQELLFEVDGDQGQRWLSKVINLEDMYPSTEVIFEAVKGDGHQSDIALDTVSITPGFCSKQNPEATDVVYCEWVYVLGLASRCDMDGSTVISCDWIDFTNYYKDTLGFSGSCLRQSDNQVGECRWVDGKLSCSWNLGEDRYVYCRYSEDDTTVKCRWENGKWGSCEWNVANPDHLRLSTGYCDFSDGHWGYCQADGQNLIGCHYGDATKYEGREYSGICAWKNGTIARSTADQSWRRVSGILGNWGVCFGYDGGYSYCNFDHCEDVPMKSNPSRTILCSWTPGYWSTVEMYEYAYGNQRWGELSLSYTGNLTGQCYMVQNKTKFTCEMARGNQMTSGRIMRCQPDDTLWARCRWQNDMVSTCYWRETIQDCILLDLGDPEFRTNNLILPDPRMSGVCYASNGYWINCRGFDNCYVGNTLRLHVRNVQVTCNWQNGESKTCALNEDSYLDCSDTAPTDSWGLCEANNGSWAWCQARRDCFLNRTLETGGHMTRIFCMQSKHQWSTCLASEQAWFRCEGASLNGISQCATDRGQWTRCLWNDGFNVECDLFTGRNSVSQAAICNSDGGEDEYNYCRWHRNETYLTECVKPWVGRLSHCYLHPGHWATCYHESSNEVGCVSGNCFNDFECHDGIECESVEYAGWNLCLNFNGSYGWCPVGKSADQCIFWGRRIPVPKPTATSIMCKIDRNTWATCDRAEGKCCDCVFSSKTDNIPTQTTLRSLQCHSEDGDVGVCSWDRDYPQQCNWRSQYNPSVLHCEFADSDIFVRCMKYSADFQTWTDCVYTDQYSDVVDNRLADGTLGRCYATNGTYGFCSISGARVLCREWASIPPLKQVQCAWGNNRYTNCTETDGRWLCSGSVTSPSEMGFCSTSDWKWGFCNGQLQCSWDQTGAKVVELLADVKMEMRVHPAILFTTPARPGKVWCVLRDSSLAGPDFSMQWYFPNGTRIPTGFSKHFVISSFLCRESGQMMSSLHILATQAKYTGTYECRTSIQNRVLVARTLVLVRGCNEDQFECPSDNSCIPHDWMCDGTADCEDLSDEVNC